MCLVTFHHLHIRQKKTCICYEQQRNRIECNTHSPHSTRWSSREDAAFHWRPPKPSEASAFVRSLIGSLRPRSAFCLTTFLETTREGIMNTCEPFIVTKAFYNIKDKSQNGASKERWPNRNAFHARHSGGCGDCKNVQMCRLIRQRLNFWSKQYNEMCSKYIE